MVSHSQGCLGTQTWDPLVSVTLVLKFQTWTRLASGFAHFSVALQLGLLQPPGHHPSQQRAAIHPLLPLLPPYTSLCREGFLDGRLEPCFCSCLPVVALWGTVLVCADFHKWPSLACVFSAGFVSGWSSELPRGGCTVLPVSLPQGPILACFLNL